MSNRKKLRFIQQEISIPREDVKFMFAQLKQQSEPVHYLLEMHNIDSEALLDEMKIRLEDGGITPDQIIDLLSE